jgi:hypothetical protein
MHIYRAKDAVEKGFLMLKNSLDAGKKGPGLQRWPGPRCGQVFGNRAA